MDKKLRYSVATVSYDNEGIDIKSIVSAFYFKNQKNENNKNRNIYPNFTVCQFVMDYQDGMVALDECFPWPT